MYYFLTVAYDIPDLQMGRGLLHGPYATSDDRDEAVTECIEDEDLETGVILNVTKLDCEGEINKDESFLASPATDRDVDDEYDRDDDYDREGETDIRGADEWGWWLYR